MLECGKILSKEITLEGCLTENRFGAKQNEPKPIPREQRSAWMQKVRKLKSANTDLTLDAQLRRILESMWFQKAREVCVVANPWRPCPAVNLSYSPLLPWVPVLDSSQ